MNFKENDVFNVSAQLLYKTTRVDDAEPSSNF